MNFLSIQDYFQVIKKNRKKKFTRYPDLIGSATKKIFFRFVFPK